MKMNELNEDFKTDIITLSQIGSIFSVKEYKIGEFYKENLSQVKEKFSEREVDYHSYEEGVIVLKP